MVEIQGMRASSRGQLTESYLTAELLAQIGVESPPYSQDIERGDLARFATSTRQANSASVDDVASRDSTDQDLVAAPTYLITMRQLQDRCFSVTGLPPHSVDGGTAWTYIEPIRVGDRITGRAKLAEVYEKEGRLGLMLFLVIEITYRNQLDKIVATQRDTYIRYG